LEPSIRKKESSKEFISFLEELLPWSETLPEHIRKPKKTSDE